MFIHSFRGVNQTYRSINGGSLGITSIFLFMISLQHNSKKIKTQYYLTLFLILLVDINIQLIYFWYEIFEINKTFVNETFKMRKYFLPYILLAEERM